MSGTDTGSEAGSKPTSGDGEGEGEDLPTETTIDDVLDHLESLEETVDAPAEQDEVRKAMRLVHRLSHNGVFGSVITQFTRKDKAEAFVGSVVIGLPMLVEDGVLDIGEFLSTNPLFFVGNLVFATLLVVGILYVAKFQEVQIHNPYFGLIPRRPVWVLAIAFTTSAVLMTMWGRVTWDEPWLHLCQVSVVFTGMAIGASLGDILPGED
ncbi:DUF2391 domain-containing protein [Halobacteria archaeon AArc-m2/3/4]|uniref:DUF2391 domain-containing protein n=1 Tax=Natronoglomus mannanivorans TaxID=2979990 RepID=A0AAP2YX82_9EURY|nr:DUF2391 domain-containing protein [Halobacteria archaeon AArc-xg1-1]MCU4973646.1 DUF2391 domain-containing protein [Halobacteria archaeon AArc-m2/3/4]